LYDIYERFTHFLLFLIVFLDDFLLARYLYG